MKDKYKIFKAEKVLLSFIFIYHMYLGQNIRHLRKKLGITQQELGDRFDVSYTAVGKWERNENVPGTNIILAMSDLFSVSIDDLIKRDLKAGTQVLGKVKRAGEEDIASQIAELEDQVRALYAQRAAGPEADVYREQLEVFKRQLIRRHPDVARDMGLIE